MISQKSKRNYFLKVLLSKDKSKGNRIPRYPWINAIIATIEPEESPPNTINNENMKLTTETNVAIWFNGG